ncbi:hypothetical protein JOL79_18580 [Microbispora sp. RL4-1S]|uniref:Tripartite tricarboxylate transporter substrate binding protein n=1 Tax=Microbispora oryzae TaxID=2806554 RepID=A0A941AK83_9ACTN|nr:tripartite tricarboxylate transporter substrate-binding protein [Microbispora oryzae]MBP2705822.1 hypothetical protein [Microbispora oryzae]
MRRRTVLALGVLALAGCGTTAPPFQGEISLVVPGAPGGCAERLAGELKALIEGRRWARTVQVGHRARGGGSSAVGRPTGRAELMIVDPALVAATGGRRALLPDRMVPLARLAGQWEVMVTAPDSPYRTFDRLAAALLRDPARVPVGGGPSAGPDHILYGMTALGLGADARLLDYTAFDDRARAIEAVIDGRTAVALGTARDVAGHVRAGRLLPLAVSSSERIDGLDAPTLSESGVRVVFADWAGLVALGTPGGGGYDALLDLCGAVAGSAAWEHCCGRNGWTPMYLEGDDFRRWLGEETRRTALTLRELGVH